MANFNPDTTNEFFQLAIQLVNQSNRTLFLTGKAGTGKTTFLKYIRQHCPKQMVITAPTGVAAINAGGVTLHSFFQLPLSPFIPETRGTGFSASSAETSNKHSLISQLRFNGEKRKILQQLELLVIDEISMVRCDILDAIDTILKHIRRRPLEPFGGVQLLLIGDMFQLPPVVRENEWRLLSDYYGGPYFFDSQIFSGSPPLCIEFNKIYRQRDEAFIDILNQVRNNLLNESGMKILDSRYQPVFKRNGKDGYIILTTHNQKASEINYRELQELPSTVFRYDAEIAEDFSERSYPAEEILLLKEGAQVMFIRNDPAEKGKRFYNGKIGTVSRLESNKVFVRCNEEEDEIEVQKEKWENIRYTLQKSTQKLESEVLGSFTQYPLRLAWAITIHKSQGLTFEKAIIDAGESFAPGQVYVALSRCTSLEGLVLQSRIRSNSIANDPRIMEFAKRNASGSQLKSELAIASQQYQQSILLAIFHFASSLETTRQLQALLQEHISSFSKESPDWIISLVENMNRLNEVGTKFNTQLQTLFDISLPHDQNQPLQQRVKAAALYYIPEIQQVVDHLRHCPVVTDSKLHSKEFNELVKELYSGIAEKQYLLEGLKLGYDPEAFLIHRKGFVLPAFSVNAYAGASGQYQESPHPALLQQLRKLRDSICAKKDLPIYLVAGSATLDELARYLPQSLDELKKINGFGAAKTESYGQQFLDIILAYCQEKDLHSLIHEKAGKSKKQKEDKSPTRAKKGETYTETLQLYRKGMTVSEIANARKLAPGTIESHFVKLVGRGDLTVSELIAPEKYARIADLLKDYSGNTITPVKEMLGDDISFGDIRLVMADLGITYSPSGDS
ncbi:MAG: helix-turn-helix domain-containing protein [Bacteroidetes bacterium]|nr:helix-turn-helix domain-containing protein [Bacteroidota bacterium]